jgi:hypothetical protein
MIKTRTLIAIAAIATCGGCGSDLAPSRSVSPSMKRTWDSAEAKVRPSKSAYAELDQSLDMQGGAAGPPGSAGALGGKAGEGMPDVTLVSRASLKIIYNANIEVIVKDLKAAKGLLKSAIGKSGGFIASDEVREQTGETRSGHWRIRVPTEQFETLREAILEIGEPVQNKADSEDVTDQYFDLEGRIKNKKTEQEAIRRYLEDKKITAKLEEIVAVERELSRISGELEQLEGTMRRLQDRTSLATIDVTFREIRDYVPPQTPTFSNRISRAFGNSLADLKVAGENVAVGVAAAAPWLLVALILVAPIALIIRRVWKMILRAQASAAAIPLADSPRAM